MTNQKKTLLGIAGFVGILVGAFQLAKVTKFSPEKVVERVVIKAVPETQEEQDIALRQFIYASITDLNRLEFSEMRKELLADNIIQVTNKVFGLEYQVKEHFVLLVSIESKFDGKAKSPVGALGLTQIMPKLAPEFAKKCGLDDFKTDDLYNETINLYLGACQFKNLLQHDRVKGNSVKALIGYNAGLHSKQMEEALKGKPISNAETSGYIQKFADKKEQHRIIKSKNPVVITKGETK